MSTSITAARIVCAMAWALRSDVHGAAAHAQVRRQLRSTAIPGCRGGGDTPHADRPVGRYAREMHEIDLRTPSLHLTLMASHESDAALYRALYTCPKVMKQIGPALSRQEADGAFARVCAHNRDAASAHRAWAIRDAATRAPHGLLAMRRAGDEAEIGLMLGTRPWTPAVGREAIAAAIAAGFDRFGLGSIWADCRQGPNERALRRLLEPFGFIRTPARRVGHSEWQLTTVRRDPDARARHPVAFGPAGG